jgi:hypothetical protein
MAAQALLRRVLAALVMVALPAGCGGEGDSPAAPDPDEPGIPTDLTDPLAFLESFARAWNDQDHEALAALLAPDFEFCVRDPQDFPWLPGGCWDRGTELRIAANMFDPDFEGPVAPVQSIEVRISVLVIAGGKGPGTIEATTDAIITVLTGPDDGWSSGTRLVFTLVVESSDGFLRLRKIKEVSKLEPGARAAGPDLSVSWSELKAVYN